MKIIELDQKIEIVLMNLGITQEQLAAKLFVTSGAITKWKTSQQLQPSRVKALAELLGMSPSDFASVRAKDMPPSATSSKTAWEQLRQRARADLIKVVRIEPDGASRHGQLRRTAGAAANRRFVVEDPDQPPPPDPEESFRIDERIYVVIDVPWSYFSDEQRQRRIHLILLMSDNDGTRLAMPEPLEVRRTQAAVSIPEGAPKRRLKLAAPPGRHEFTAIYFDTPLEELDGSLAMALSGADALATKRLDDLADALLRMPPASRLVATKTLFVYLG